MSANDYNEKQFMAKAYGFKDITELVHHYQSANSLTVDGLLGPKTLAHLRGPTLLTPIKHAPMLPDITHGKPVITSAHWTENPSRAPSAAYHGHQGVDIMYRLNKSIGAVYISNLKQTRRSDGTFVVQGNTQAYAVDDVTVVDVADRANGYAVVVQRAAGDVFVYRHLQGFAVSKGEVIAAGTTIGEVGHTTETSLVHLHFEWHKSLLELRQNYRGSLNPGPLCAALGIKDAYNG